MPGSTKDRIRTQRARRRPRLNTPTKTQLRLQAVNPRPWWVWRRLNTPTSRTTIGPDVYGGAPFGGPAVHFGGPPPAAGASVAAIRKQAAVEEHVARQRAARLRS